MQHATNYMYISEGVVSKKCMYRKKQQMVFKNRFRLFETNSSQKKDNVLLFDFEVETLGGF